MNKGQALLVAGLVFLIVCAVHVARIAMGWDVMVDTYMVPMWVSMVGAVVTFLLAVWMFKASRS